MGPQCEDGYTKLANELLDALCRIRIPGESMQIFLVILRKTYGYGKKRDWISLSQFADATGMKRQNVYRAIKQLQALNVIAIEKFVIQNDSLVIQNDSGSCATYEINKQYTTWVVEKRRQTRPILKPKVEAKTIPSGSQNDSDLSSKTIPIGSQNDDNKRKERKKENIKEKKPCRPPSGEQQTFFAWWLFAYRKVYAQAYAGNPGADGALIKQLLGKVPLTRMIASASLMMISKDPFFMDKCIDIKFFKSQFDRIKCKFPAEIVEELRELGIAPPHGVKFEDWKFWESDI